MAVSDETKNKGGRPTKLTPEAQRAICDAVRRKLPRSKCARAGKIARDTLYSWEREGQAALAKSDRGEALDELEQALAEFALALDEAEAAVIEPCIDEMLETKSNAVVNARTWFLETRFPRDFPRQSKVSVTGIDDGPLTMKHEATVQVVELPPLESDERTTRSALAPESGSASAVPSIDSR